MNCEQMLKQKVETKVERESEFVETPQKLKNFSTLEPCKVGAWHNGPGYFEIVLNVNQIEIDEKWIEVI